MRRLGNDPVSGARLGAAVLAVSSLLVLVTISFLHASEHNVLVGMALAVGSIVLAGALYSLPWRRLPIRALLIFPLAGFLSLGLGAALTPKIVTAYTGFITVGFVYVGLTQRRWTSVLLLPFAIPTWVAGQGGFSPTTDVRLPVTIGIWLIVGELLSARTAQTQAIAGQLRTEAQTDPLTGLANRRALDGMLLGLSSDDAVVVLDIDYFKAINDDYGHEAGDRVLVDLATMLRARLRRNDAAVRYGGDEFVVVMRSVSAATVDGLLTKLQAEWGSKHQATFSAGTAFHDGESAKTTLRRADQALYFAKQEERGSFQYAPWDGTEPRVLEQ